jgi:hypothetical protein
MLSRTSATSAGSASGGSTRSSAIGDTQLPSGSTGSRDDSTGGREGPSSIGRARRWRPRSISRHTLVAIRYSHDRTLERPSKRSPARQARTIVSCTASSASKPEPSIR